MSWASIQLEEYLDEGKITLQTGPFGTQLKASEYTPTGTPVINVRNIGYGRLRPDKLEYVPERKAMKLERHILQKDDIVFGRKGAVDRHLLVGESEKGWVQGSDCIRLRIHTSEINPTFLSYAFNLPNHKAWMLTQCSNKATMASLNQDVISRIGVRIPEENIQAKVVDILSAYDDLIENNRRRIQLLEDAARLLYKEWFVHLRFPGHEHVRVVDGVPEGWERKMAFDVMEVKSGGTPKTKVPEYWDGLIPFFTPKDATDHAYAFSTQKTITDEGLKKCNSKLYPKDTVFITARGTVGKINLAQVSMAMNQSCYALVAKEPLPQYFLYFALVDGVEQFKRRATGAVFDAIVVDTFKLIPFLVPTNRLIALFLDNATPLLDQIDRLSRQNRQLTQARELLLPKLMNGEVVV